MVPAELTPKSGNNAMKKFLAIFALAGVVGVSACAAEDSNTEVIDTPEATTPPAIVDPAPIVVDVDSVPPVVTDSVIVDSVAP